MLPFFKRSKALAAPGFAERIGLSEEELSEFRARAADITENWEWFDGTKLAEPSQSQPGKDGEIPLRFPLQLNPAVQATRLHAYCLAGEVKDSSDPLVRTMLDPAIEDDRDEPSTAAKKSARHAERVLSNIEYENNARSADTDAFLAIQPLGAIVCKIGWEPNNPDLPTGIRHEYLDPRHFWCRWESSYWRLEEAWVIRAISREEAASFGVQLDNATGTYVEYWDREKYRITIDEKIAKDKDNKPFDREHNWGFVPFIYVPHERAGEFWGRSLIPESIGLIKELNARLADMGDAMHLAVNSMIVARNIKGGHPIEKTLPNGQPYVDIGRSLGSGDPAPEMERLDSPAVPAGTERFNEILLELIRIGLQTPDIAYGKDEGSQRSGQTLYNRMWPLLAHVRTERTHWTEARNLRAEMDLKILAKMQKAGITQEHLGLRKRQLWAPMVPIDRAQMVDELVRLKESDAISYDLMVERLGHTADVPAEVKAIWRDIERMINLEQKVEMLAMEHEMELKEKEIAIKREEQEMDLEFAEAKHRQQMEAGEEKLEFQSRAQEQKIKQQQAAAKAAPKPKPGAMK